MGIFSFLQRSQPSNTELQSRMDRLESEFKSVRLEWDTTYDKIVHQFDRARKRRLLPEDANGPLVPENGTKEPENLWEIAHRTGLLSH